MTIPTAIVRSSIAMLPRLQAEESILAVNRTALGSGSLAKDDARALSRTWSKAANGGQEQPAIRISTDDPAKLKDLGIGVKRGKVRRG